MPHFPPCGNCRLLRLGIAEPVLRWSQATDAAEEAKVGVSVWKRDSKNIQAAGLIGRRPYSRASSTWTRIFPDDPTRLA